MSTDGETSNEQFKFIFELFNNGYVYLDKEKCINLRLKFSDKIIKQIDKYPTIVRIN
jgi:hypothetical protein